MKKFLSNLISSIQRDPLTSTACAAAFGMGFSLPLARSFTAAAGIMLIISCIKKRKLPFFPPTAWLALAFFIIALVATIYGIRPARGLDKIDKLAWLLAIPIMGSIIDNIPRLRRFVTAFFIGTCALSVRVCFENPIMAWLSVKQGTQPDYTTSLINNSSLSDGQRLALGVLAGIILLASYRQNRAKRKLWGVLTMVTAVGEIVCLKRGPWIAVILCGSTLAGSIFGWRRFILYGLLGFSILLSLPPVSKRIVSLRFDADASHGGRMTMWTQIAPELLKEHPWGVGFRSLRDKDLRKIAHHVEPNQDHLHSNPIQVAVATGLHGLLIFLIWMIWALRDAFKTMKHSRSAPDELRYPAKAPLIILSALMLIGLIEYNIADARLLIIYAAFIGISARLARPPSTYAAEQFNRKATRKGS